MGFKEKSNCIKDSVYIDDGYTGTNFDRRPAFNEMMEKVRSREINLVVVKDLSRFGRNYLEVGQYTETLWTRTQKADHEMGLLTTNKG